MGNGRRAHRAHYVIEPGLGPSPLVGGGGVPSITSAQRAGSSPRPVPVSSSTISGEPDAGRNPMVRDRLEAQHAQAVDAQAAARAARASEETTSWTDDPAAFQAAYAAARRRRRAGEAPVPYFTTDATGALAAPNGGRRFGLEIEFDIGGVSRRREALDAIGAELHAAGLTASAHQQPYGAQRRRGYTTDHYRGWAFEYDSTVHGELSSPICSDDPETWESLGRVCEIVRRHGGVATRRTGGHVHVEVGDYDHLIGNHNDLVASVRAHEDTLYRLAQNPARTRHRGVSWCYPGDAPADGYTSLASLRMDTRRLGHTVGVNFESVAGQRGDHVEFRMWDSSLDPAVIQTQAKVSLGLAHAAVVSPGSRRAPDPLGTHRDRNLGRGRLRGAAWNEDTANFRQLVDRIFVREQDKVQAASLFAVTRWQHVW